MKRMKPQARQFSPPKGLQWDIAVEALEKWSPALAAADAGENSISILDAIGTDPWTGDGVTAKRVAAALRGIGADKNVVVNINSPGGDFFEGLAIYELLREHKGNVTVKVLGLAASAASIVAMAGDEVQIARSGFLMVHNTWVIALGNRNDLRDIADTLEEFDGAALDIYAARASIDQRAIAKMMDKETWIRGETAVEQGFADALLASDEVKDDPGTAAKADVIAAHLIELAMAKQGVPRSRRRALMNEFKSGTHTAAGSGTPGAAGNGTHDAAAAVRQYLDFLTQAEITS